MSGPGVGNCGQLLTDGSHCVLPAGHYQSEPDDDHENGYGVSLMAAGRGDSMTRSKRRRNLATLAVDLNELDAIITALVNDSGTAPQPDPGLLSYLDTKRTNLRKRVSGTDTENTVTGLGESHLSGMRLQDQPGYQELVNERTGRKRGDTS